MKISRGFVRGFLIALFVIVLANVISLVLGRWNIYYLLVFSGFLIGLFFLMFRKNQKGSIRVLAWTLPVLFILLILYINFLPFGFQKEYTMTIGYDGSVVSSSPQMYLQDMMGNKITNLAGVYNYSFVSLVLKPRFILKNAMVNASVIGDNIYFAKTNFSAGNNSWDYLWNFSKSVPDSLVGNAKYNNKTGCVYFNGSNNETLYYPSSSGVFETGSFIFYAKWKPENMNKTAQQIVGHSNWELWQNNNSVEFMIVRLENKSANISSIYYKIDKSFFNKTHEALVVYRGDKTGSGYIELFVDGNFSGRKSIGNKNIWMEYNGEGNLTFGKSSYVNSSYYDGCIYQVGFDYGKMSYLRDLDFISEDRYLSIPIVGNGSLNEIKLRVEK
jgi:hypothetical protein